MRKSTSLTLFTVISVSLAWSDRALGRELSFEDRVKAQTAIERVLWVHRIWPDENPSPKPPFEQIMPEEKVREKVQDVLRKSNELEKYWSRPITAEQLQAEVDRMSRGTRQPDVLEELFSSLNHDPLLIAECLARPILVDRLIQNWYARDGRFHGDTRRKAEAALERHGTVEGMRLLGGQYSESRRRKRTTLPGAADPPRHTGPGDEESDPAEILDGVGWDSMLRSHIVRFAFEPDEPDATGSTAVTSGPLDVRLPIHQLSAIWETNDAFYVEAVLEQSPELLRTAVVVWRKTPFGTWWRQNRAQLAADLAPPSESYTLAPLDAGCSDDTWTPTASTLPEPRAGHTAVWTGSEMIVWGGDNYVPLNTGGRYDPFTDSWASMSLGPNVPSPRDSHTAVWTGSEMIVWGGWDGASSLKTGGRYDPLTDTWTPTSASGDAPSPRDLHTAIWTGSEMIVWGGENGTTDLDTGARYDPRTDLWAKISMGPNTPTPRRKHTSVWTGRTMIAWGGCFGTNPRVDLASGGQYDPRTDSWTPTRPETAPYPREGHTAIWTGRLMVVWGGLVQGGGQVSGGRYDPETDTWSSVNEIDAPSSRDSHTAVWTGSRMIVWGNDAYDDTGGQYDPVSNTWTETAAGDVAPLGRRAHTAVWTGKEMIVWGGVALVYQDSGGRYNPHNDTWAPTSTGAPIPEARVYHTAVWTGNEMIVWGGRKCRVQHRRPLRSRNR